MCSNTHYLSHHGPCSKTREGCGVQLGLHEEGECWQVARPLPSSELGKLPNNVQDSPPELNSA